MFFKKNPHFYIKLSLFAFLSDSRKWPFPSWCILPSLKNHTHTTSFIFDRDQLAVMLLEYQVKASHCEMTSLLFIKAERRLDPRNTLKQKKYEIVK